MKNSINQIIAALLSSILLFATISGAQADFVATESAFDQARVEYQKSDLIRTLQSEQVQTKLLDMGVNPSDVEDRVAAMTADEISQLNQHIDNMPAGGDALGIVLTLFIVFVITDAICATDIFPFVNCIN